MDYIAEKSAFYRYLYSQVGLINAGQSSETRKNKYNLARILGCSVATSRRLRDFRADSFARYLGYKNFEHLMIELRKAYNRNIAVRARTIRRKIKTDGIKDNGRYK